MRREVGVADRRGVVDEALLEAGAGLGRGRAAAASTSWRHRRASSGSGVGEQGLDRFAAAAR